MLPSLTLAPRAGPRWSSRLLVVVLAVIPAFAPCTFPAQTANPQEISTRDVEPTFKLQAERNLVMVRVVVRDAKGATVDNLRQEDFQLFDHGRLQTILHFSLEKSALKATPAQKADDKTAAAGAEVVGQATLPASAARRFVALYFDDVNTSFEDLARARDAAGHFLAARAQPGDRWALYTSSGQKQVDFTGDLAQVYQALLDLRPRPIVEEAKTCGAVPPYEAYLIVDQQDPAALAVAAQELLSCNACPALTAAQQQRCFNQAQDMARSEAMQSLTFSETQSTAA